MLFELINSINSSLEDKMFGSVKHDVYGNPIAPKISQSLELSLSGIKSFTEDQRQIIESITKTTPDYSYPEFESYAIGVLNDLLKSRQTLMLDHFSNCLSKEYYHRLCSDYLDLKSRGLINVNDRIRFQRFYLDSVDNIDAVDTINVKAYLSYRDYYRSADTGLFLRGKRYDSDNYLCCMTFIKNGNYDQNNVKIITNCPNCNALLDEGSINVCKYCETVVPLPEKQWLLSNCKFEIEDSRE